MVLDAAETIRLFGIERGGLIGILPNKGEDEVALLATPVAEKGERGHLVFLFRRVGVLVRLSLLKRLLLVW